MGIKESIGWAEETMNAIHGCTAGCDYCYARRMAYRLAGRCGYPKKDPFNPSFSPDQLKKLDRKKPTRFFISSMGDMFDRLARDEWRERVYIAMRKNPQHTYLILTKQPQNMRHCENRRLEALGLNLFIGVSIAHPGDLWRIQQLKANWQGKRFISFEPLLKEIYYPFDIEGISYIIIGGQSGPKPFYPPKEWVDNIKRQAKVAGIPVYLKKNLRKGG